MEKLYTANQKIPLFKFSSTCTNRRASRSTSRCTRRRRPIVGAEHELEPRPITCPSDACACECSCRTCGLGSAHAAFPATFANVQSCTSSDGCERQCRGARCAHGGCGVAAAGFDSAGYAATDGEDGDVGVVSVERDGGIIADGARDCCGIDVCACWCSRLDVGGRECGEGGSCEGACDQ
jgi:hypothetical protein